jgi:hypothetical protein
VIAWFLLRRCGGEGVTLPGWYTEWWGYAIQLAIFAFAVWFSYWRRPKPEAPETDS